MPAINAMALLTKMREPEKTYKNEVALISLSFNNHAYNIYSEKYLNEWLSSFKNLLTKLNILSVHLRRNCLPTPDLLLPV